MAQVIRWSKKEVIVVIYFSSRGIRPKSVRLLLLRRGFDRSCRAIEAKIALVLRNNAYLRFSKGRWDWRAVDKWIDDLLGSHELVNDLIYLAAQDAEDVTLVS